MSPGRRRQAPPEDLASTAHRFPVRTAARDVLVAPPPGTRSGRRELRRARRRRQRLVLLAAAALAVVGLVVGLVIGVGGRTTPSARPSVPTRTQHTLLLVLRSPGGTAWESALVAHDTASHDGVEVLVPSGVIGEVPGAGSLPFGQVTTLPDGAALAGDTLADLMGVTVDSTWVLDGPAFTGLVNALGGVTVDVQTTVLVPLRHGGALVALSPGRQRLTGRQALQYATYLAPGEPPVADLPRMQAVLDAVFAELPANQATVRRLLGRLADGSVTAGQPPWAVLTGFAADVRAAAVSYSTLPVLAIDTGGGSTEYRVDPVGLHQLVVAQLSDSVPAQLFDGHNRVLVENGVGTPGLGASVRDRLVAAGMQFIGSRNAAHFGYRRTLVLIFQATTQAEALGDRVAGALGLSPSAAVRLSDRDQSVADIIVIIGADYRP